MNLEINTTSSTSFMREYALTRLKLTTPENAPTTPKLKKILPIEPAKTTLELLERAQNGRQAPAELAVPNSQQLFSRPFAKKFQTGLFLGSSSFLKRSEELEQFRRVRLTALSIFNQGEDFLTPAAEPLHNTEQAAKVFFAASYRMLSKTGQSFPLAAYNKCLGMVAMPNSNFAMIAISQDKNPELDQALREKVVLFLDALNDQLRQENLEWRFKLACIPTYSQYLMPRTLSKDTHLPATDDDIEPHTRCVEVALMVALNKIGRFKQFTPKDVGVMAFGGTLWATPESNDAIDYFKGIARNKKHVKKSPIEIKLDNDISAWIDIWQPCPCHCEIYQHQMAAIAAAGGRGTSFAEPCFEEPEICPEPNSEINRVTL